MSWPILARFSTLGEAESSRSALQAAGIDVLVADEYIVGVNWLYSNAVGGVKLSVSEEDREQSSVILASAFEEASSLEDELTDALDESDAADSTALPESSRQPEKADDQEQEIRCPACDSADVMPIPRLALFVFLALVVCAIGYAVDQRDLALAGVLVAALIAAIAPSQRCRACGERWTAAAPPETVAEAPAPDPFDTIEQQCPRCGSVEFHHINYRRLKTIPLLVAGTIIVVLPAWLFLPKWQCDDCGLTAHCAARSEDCRDLVKPR